MNADRLRRHALLLTAIVFLVGGIAGSFSGQLGALSFILLRVGIVIFVIWLALPQLLERSPRTPLVIGIVVAFALVAVLSRRLLPLLLVGAVVFLVLQTLGRRLTSALQKTNHRDR